MKTHKKVFSLGLQPSLLCATSECTTINVFVIEPLTTSFSDESFKYFFEPPGCDLEPHFQNLGRANP